MQEYIDSCHKESKSHTVYQKHSTAHFNNVGNITIDTDSRTQQKKQNGRE